jgi:hypothetical protein
MNIEENDDQMVDTSLLPDFSLLGIEEDEKQEEILDDAPPVIDKEEVEEPVEEVTEDAAEDAEAISTFYQMFKERGILPDKEVTTIEDLESEIEAYKTELPNQIRESIVNSASEHSQGLINYALTKPNATKDDLLEYLQAEQNDNEVAAISSDVEARNFLEKVYAKEHDDVDVLNAMLDTMQDKGTLQAKAKSMADSQSAKLTVVAQEEAQQLETSNQEWQTSIASEFEAQTWKPDHKKKVMEQFNDGELDKRVQQIIADPKSLVQLANILSYYDTEKNTFNLDTFFTKASTQKTKSVRDRIVSSAQNRNSSTKPRTKPSEAFDLSQYTLVN